MKHFMSVPLAAALAVMACSGEGEQNPARTSDVDVERAGDDGAEAAADAPGEAPAQEVEFQRKVQGSLTAPEREQLEVELVALGVDPGDVVFVGRTVLWDDVYLDADELLQGKNQALDKGRTLSQIFEPEVGTAPHIYTRLRNASGASCSPQGPSCFFEFHRPDTDVGHVFVVPDEVPATGRPLRTMFQNAIDAITGAASDCLTGTGSTVSLRVLSASEWSAVGPGQATIPNTYVVYNSVAQACPGGNIGTRGCSFYPRFRQPLPEHMRVGGRIGLVSSYVTGNNRDSQWAVTHEVMHTLGFAHTLEEAIDKLRVPGSDGSATAASIMHKFCYPCYDTAISTREACPADRQDLSCNMTFTLSADDKRAIDSLYSPQAGSSCSYQGVFERIAPAQCWSACTKVTADNIAGECCTCGGVTKSFVRSSFNANTYLCSGT